MCTVFFPRSKSAIPSLPRVISIASCLSLRNSVRPADSSFLMSLPIVIPRAVSTSGSFGVAAVMPENSASENRESIVAGMLFKDRLRNDSGSHQTVSVIRHQERSAFGNACLSF